MRPPAFVIFISLLTAGIWPVKAQEFRALWVDAFHAGLRTSSETSAVIAAARSANCNAVVVEIRKRGDAYYRNGLEPVATDVAAGFDPLADLIQKGHTGTPRIEVHAWFVSFNIWNNETTPPTQPTHPYNLHPDWLSQDSTGTQWDGGNYQFDPGHPDVQQHTYDVVMDVLTRYNVDGIHLDYIRYSENGGATIGYQPWGYNPVAVTRFKAMTGTSTTPTPDNSAWLQWRRDQVTALVRKIYLNAWALKPSARVSAALIPWGSPPADLSLSAWQNTNPYGRVLQDWRAWMQEGILDLACPMIYRTDNSGMDGWGDFLKERQYNRAGAVGLGWYLNTNSNTITQIGLARAASSTGKTSAGIVGYSYAVPDSSTSNTQADTWAALTAPGTGPYASLSSVPSMPWKTNTSVGHLMATLVDSASGDPFDGATVMLTGPTNRTLTCDGTGFVGAVDLPVGTYTLTINRPGYRSVTKTVTVTGAQVAQPPLTIERLPFIITNSVRNVPASTMTITWNSLPGKTYKIERSQTAAQWTTVTSGLPSAGGSTSYVWQIPANWTTQGFVRVVEEN